ncbi:MAG: transporter related protein [Candidatus Doudnabacteria bacterium]|nr:transporter related protein [Candidatus Doudnabacteria bacterium]
MIKVENLFLHYRGKTILHDINFSVAENEFVCLVGESGSGKTTLLKVIAGLLKQSRGTVLKEHHVSMVFQSAALLPWLTVRENIEFPLKTAGKDYDTGLIDKTIKEVSLSEHQHKYPRDLSGGQRQRVGIARALVVNRKILLLDEPFSALDIKTSIELRQDLLRLWKQNNLTIVMVSHLVEEAVELADRIVIMQAGKIRREVNFHLERPRELESKSFLKVVDHVKELIEN